MSAPKKKSAPVKSLRTVDKLARLGLSTDMSLVLHLPMRYEDETRILNLNEAGLMHGQNVQVEGVVTACDVQYRPRRQLIVTLSADGCELMLRFLNFYGSQATQMAVGKRLRVRGEMRHGFFGNEMVHPVVKAVEEGAPLPQALHGTGLLQPAPRLACANTLPLTPGRL